MSWGGGGYAQSSGVPANTARVGQRPDAQQQALLGTAAESAYEKLGYEKLGGGLVGVSHYPSLGTLWLTPRDREDAITCPGSRTESSPEVLGRGLCASLCTFPPAAAHPSPYPHSRSCGKPDQNKLNPEDLDMQHAESNSSPHATAWQHTAPGQRRRVSL